MEINGTYKKRLTPPTFCPNLLPRNAKGVKYNGFWIEIRALPAFRPPYDNHLGALPVVVPGHYDPRAQQTGMSRSMLKS